MVLIKQCYSRGLTLLLFISALNINAAVDSLKMQKLYEKGKYEKIIKVIEKQKYEKISEDAINMYHAISLFKADKRNEDNIKQACKLISKVQSKYYISNNLSEIKRIQTSLLTFLKKSSSDVNHFKDLTNIYINCFVLNKKITLSHHGFQNITTEYIQDNIKNKRITKFYTNILTTYYTNLSNQQKLHTATEIQNTIFQHGKALFESNDTTEAFFYFNLLIKHFGRGAYQYLYNHPQDIYSTKNKHFKEYNYPLYRLANTGLEVNEFNKREKQVIYYLNLCRLNPELFAKTYLKEFIKEKYSVNIDSVKTNNNYVSSLFDTLENLSTLPILYPDNQLIKTAQCFAVEAGKNGITGHQRINCDNNYGGECCHYGRNPHPIEIVLSLLIDEGIPNLGHRKNILDQEFSKIGVAIRKHIEFGENTVIDFK